MARVTKLRYFLIIMSAMAVGVFVLTQKSTNDSGFELIKKASEISCVGINVNRSVINQSNYLTFVGLKDSIGYTEAQSKNQIAALKHLGFGKKLLKSAIDEGKRQLQNQKERKRTLLWAQMSDCSYPELSETEAHVYKFIDKIPDLSQLSVDNAKLLTPRGAVIPQRKKK